MDTNKKIVINKQRFNGVKVKVIFKIIGTILQNPVWLPAIVNIIFILFTFVFIILFGKNIIQKIFNKMLNRILTDSYSQNITEVFTSEKRISALKTLELNLRAQSGMIIERPMGSPKVFANFDMLMFSPPIMTKMSLAESTKIDMQVTLGPTAQKPLNLKIPLIITGMAYGTSLSEEAKRALARAAKIMETATNSGDGPFLPEERQDAGKYILQISRWPWGGRTDEQIAVADMLEVQMGQGADMGAAVVKPLHGKAEKMAGLAPGQPPISLPAPPGVQTLEDWPIFISGLRQKANGIPVGLKLMATGRLEEELEVAISLGFDVIALDGAQGGTYGTPPIKQDDFGMPTLNALVRADRYLKARGVRERISLISAGGYFAPGDCLKALALGADAIYLGSLCMMALVNGQTNKVTPWEVPATLVFYDSPTTHKKLNIDQAALSVINMLTSMIAEMEEGMRALGKSSLKELTPDDLVALDTYTAEVTGVKRIY